MEKSYTLTKLMAKNAFLQKSLGKYSLKILWEIFLIFCILPTYLTDPLSIFKGQNPVVLYLPTT